MKTSLLAFAAAALFAAVAHAQLVTYDTRPFYVGNAITFDADSGTTTQGEVFTNVLAIKSMTYNFFTGTSGNNIASTLTAVFGQWNGSGFVNGTTVDFGTITIPAATSGQWSSTLANDAHSGGAFLNFAYTFDLSSISSSFTNATYGYLTNASNSYAMMLTLQDSNDTGVALGEISGNPFAYGYEEGTPSRDWTFAQLAVVPNDGDHSIAPAPEPATVAAMCAALLIGGLAFLRLRQRQLALVPVSAA